MRLLLVRIAFLLLVLLGVGLLVAGTIFGGPASAGRAHPPSPDIDPLKRLGMWHGSAYHSIAEPGSIRSGHLYVLVHGWAGGMKAAVDAYPGPGPLLAWDEQAREPDGTPFIDLWLAPMAAALSALDPEAVVLAYSWLDESATAADPLDAHFAGEERDENGERLGRVLDEAIAPEFWAAGGEVHLIAHSFGAKVATLAALRLDRPPTQATTRSSAFPTATTKGSSPSSTRTSIRRSTGCWT